jgi:hypothetical protein
MTSYMLIMFLYDVISACRDVTDVRCRHVHVDTSHSPADFGEILRGKKADRTKPWGFLWGCEVRKRWSWFSKVRVWGSFGRLRFSKRVSKTFFMSAPCSTCINSMGWGGSCGEAQRHPPDKNWTGMGSRRDSQSTVEVSVLVHGLCGLCWVRSGWGLTQSLLRIVQLLSQNLDVYHPQIQSIPCASISPSMDTSRRW